jgi:metal-responsive CopG/Arc/MetJ family transcriptional regulator
MKTERVVISMHSSFLERVDELAGAEQLSRSETIREALKHFASVKHPEIDMVNLSRSN